MISKSLQHVLHFSSSARSKPSVIVLGCGWGGYRCANNIDKSKYNVQLVSPRNYFLFTPLLPSTAVGTLEFRCIQEPVRSIKGLTYHQATCTTIDSQNSKIHCVDAFNEKSQFDLHYDALVVAPGCQTNTFGCKGLYDNKHVFFLKQLSDSRGIRNRLIECFERACAPTLSIEERQRLLTFIVVGGGPTSVEFAAELYDFLHDDVSRWYPELMKNIQVKLVEATGHILGTFNQSLVSYTERLFRSRKIQLLTGMYVKEVQDNVAIFGNGEKVPFGLMVWSTGVKPIPLVESLGKAPDCIQKLPNGRIATDDYLRVMHTAEYTAQKESPGVIFALGDCAANSHKPLPQLAQVAQQQGHYLADLLNHVTVSTAEKFGSAVARTIEESEQGKNQSIKKFQYKHLGSMASIGDWKGVYDSRSLEQVSRQEQDKPTLKGFLAFLLWRAAYWTRSVSIPNKMLIPMYWFKSAMFGRDISRF